MRRETREKTVTYDVYVAKDGKEFSSIDECIGHEKMLDGERITCPECNGKGRVNERSERVFDGGLYGDHQYHTYWTSDKCEKCNGKGYLEKKITWE